MSQDLVSVLVPVLGVVITLAGGIVTWFLNERSKRAYEEYKRKEARYSELISSLRGFYVSSQDNEMRAKFLNQLNLCWLYCPDEVIRKAYTFLLTVHTDRGNLSASDAESAVGELMLAIRQDLINRNPLRRTRLKPEEFRHLAAT